MELHRQKDEGGENDETSSKKMELDSGSSTGDVNNVESRDKLMLRCSNNFDGDVKNAERRNLTMLSCSSCAALFRQRGSLNRHVKTVHHKKREFQCGNCGKAFGRLAHLR